VAAEAALLPKLRLTLTGGGPLPQLLGPTSTKLRLTPLYLSAALATAIPSRCLSRISERSNSANAPIFDNNSFDMELSLTVPISVLTNEVRQAIKIRGGSGFARRSVLNDDSYSIESTVPVNHSPDLSWLLAEQYQNRPD
jgi:hypothetical protein